MCKSFIKINVLLIAFSGKKTWRHHRKRRTTVVDAAIYLRSALRALPAPLRTSRDLPAAAACLPRLALAGNQLLAGSSTAAWLARGRTHIDVRRGEEIATWLPKSARAFRNAA